MYRGRQVDLDDFVLWDDMLDVLENPDATRSPLMGQRILETFQNILNQTPNVNKLYGTPLDFDYENNQRAIRETGSYIRVDSKKTILQHFLMALFLQMDTLPDNTENSQFARDIINTFLAAGVNESTKDSDGLDGEHYWTLVNELFKFFIGETSSL